MSRNLPPQVGNLLQIFALKIEVIEGSSYLIFFMHKALDFKKSREFSKSFGILKFLWKWNKKQSLTHILKLRLQHQNNFYHDEQFSQFYFDSEIFHIQSWSKCNECNAAPTAIIVKHAVQGVFLEVDFFILQQGQLMEYIYVNIRGQGGRLGGEKSHLRKHDDPFHIY